MKVSKYKHMGQPVTPLLAVGIGISVCIVLTLLLSAAAAWLVAGERLPQNAISSVSLPIQIIATFIGCLTAMLISGKMPAIIAAICAGGYFALLICINILILDSSFSGIGKGLISTVSGAFVAVLVSLIGNKKKTYGNKHTH